VFVTRVFLIGNAASIAETLHDMHHYGFSGGDSNAASFDWSFIKKARDKCIVRLNGIYYRNMQGSGVTKFLGTAKLITRDRKVAVTTDEGQETLYLAKNILIAAGGCPNFPEGAGIKEYGISSDGFFELEDLPKKAVVVGAGSVLSQ
jgi:glutathione reductase (NADPH)